MKERQHALALSVQRKIAKKLSHYLHLASNLQNQAELEITAGCWPAAKLASRVALKYAKLADDLILKKYSHSSLAAAHFALGHNNKARREFRATKELEDQPYLWSLRGIWEAELKLATGNLAIARTQTESNQSNCRQGRWIRDVALCDTVLGHLALPLHSAKARIHLTAARGYASRSGDVEVTLRCYHLAAEIARHEGNFVAAESEALSGIQLADSCGFGHWSIIIRLELARIHLAAGRYGDALEPATWALARSEHPECQYAWGVADGLHLLGVAHARLGDVGQAREYLRRAVEKRRPLEHPGLAESEEELRRLSD